MKTSSFGLLLFFAVVSVRGQQICELCDCQPSNIGIFSVTCDGQNVRDFHMTASLMVGAESTTMLVIKNSPIVSVEKSSFVHLEKLGTFVVQNCSRVYLSTGTFENLNSIWLTLVGDVSFGKMALMGARGVKNIIVSLSNITEIPRYSLFDLEGIEKVHFMGVNVGTIKSDAFNVKTRSFTFVNSTFNHIESNALTVQAQKVLITKNYFNTMEPGAVKITTDFQTRFLENNFAQTAEINITSPFAEFYENDFNTFLSESVYSVDMPRVISNIIRHSNLDRLLRTSDHRDFYDNEIACSCGMLMLQSAEKSKEYEILKKNFCIAKCAISLFEFEVKSLPACKRHPESVKADDYCTVQSTYRNKSSSGSEEMVHLEPRFLNSAVKPNGSSGSSESVSKIYSFVLLTYVFTLLTRWGA